MYANKKLIVLVTNVLNQINIFIFYLMNTIENSLML